MSHVKLIDAGYRFISENRINYSSSARRLYENTAIGSLVVGTTNKALMTSYTTWDVAQRKSAMHQYYTGVIVP